jgi:hypothetical protein
LEGERKRRATPNLETAIGTGLMNASSRHHRVF